jgi:hypothetical protein
MAGRDVHARATGRLAPPDRSPVELDGAEVLVRPGASGPTIEVPKPGGAIVVPVPRELGTWSALHVGELRFVAGRQPALRASWYGSQVQLAFESDADRDAAATVLRASVDR